MKKIAYIVALFAICFATSCDDKLDITPKGVLIPTKTEDFSNFLNFPEFYTWDDAWPLSFDCGINEKIILSMGFNRINHLGLADNRLPYYRNSSYTSFNDYSKIKNYNVVIDNIMSSEGPDTLKRRALAEARVKRAWVYFNMVNMCAKPYNKLTAKTDGGVVLRLKFDMEEAPYQATVQEVYDAMENDLLQAIPNLTMYRENYLRVNKATAYAVLAKVYLFKGDFDKAEMAAKEAWKLNSYVFDMVAWDKGPKPTPFVGQDNPQNLLWATAYFGNSSLNCIGPNLVRKFEKGDLRKDRFYYRAAPSFFTKGSYRQSQYTDTINGRPTSRNFQINQEGIKTSEVLLMIAECEIRRGAIQDGMNHINELRKKRILPAYYKDLTAANIEEGLAIIMDERSKELIPSAVANFHDIRRYEAEGRHTSAVRVLNDGTSYTVSSSSTNYTLPFPVSAIENTPGLKQNVER